MSGITIFMYHQVGRFPPMEFHRASYCDVDRFRAQMRYLKVVGATVLSMTNVLQVLRGETPLPRCAVALTFDDGYENFYENALPILRQYNYPATAYILGALTGGPAAWLDPGVVQPPLMSWSRIRDLPRYGIEVGSHGLNHKRLNGLDAKTLREEVTGSKTVIEDKLGLTVSHFCYPYGNHDLAALHAVAAAGYVSAVTCQRGAATPDFDPLALPRKGVSFGDSIMRFAWKLHMKNEPKGPALHRQ